MFPLTWLGGLSGKVTAFAFIALLVGAGAYVVVQKLEIRGLKTTVSALTEEKNALTVDNRILKENNETLKDGLKKLALANQTNYNTAKQLQEERAKATTAIANLAAANRRSGESLDRLNRRLEEMLKDPNNDGPVAPVLREVIREIQKERGR